MGLSGFGAAAGPKAPCVGAQTGPRQRDLALTRTTLVAKAWSFGFGAAAESKAPYVSAKTGPRQPVWALTWPTQVADA